MTGSVRIEPVPVLVGSIAAPASEIRLGSTLRGAVVLVHERSRSAEVLDIMNELAMHGYESVAVTCPCVGPAPASWDRQVAQILAAAEHLEARGRDRDNIGLLGLGAGGRGVLRAAVRERFGAAVSMSPIDRLGPAAAVEWMRKAAADGVRTPWLGLFAAREQDRLSEQIRLYGEAISQASPVHTLTVTYRHVGPEFYQDRGDSMTHAAAYDAWQRSVEWLNLQVAPPTTSSAQTSHGGRCGAIAPYPQQEE